MAGGRALQLISRASRERGAISAELADQALGRLTESQRISSYWPGDYPQDRREGIDFVVTRADGVELGLQVKSSKSGRQKSKEHHPEVPCVVVESGDSVEIIMMHILNVLGRK